MELYIVPVVRPEGLNVILGQTHFIKSVEDLHEALVNAVPGIRFGLAFCEASGDRLVRWSGADDELVAFAQRNALAIGAGHSFVVVLGAGFYPVNVLNAIKLVPRSAGSSAPRPTPSRWWSPRRRSAAVSSA